MAGPDERFKEPGNGKGWPGRWIAGSGIRLWCVEAGPADGERVVLLHGFPDLAGTWRKQIPALARQGWRVTAVDLRGYGRSDKPRRVRDYRIEALVADVEGVIKDLGGRAAVCGHDWGGIIGWHLAMRRPELVNRLVTLNAPHPLAYRREVWRSSQLLRSWYVAAFQVPWVPEWALAAGDHWLMRRVLRAGPARGADDEERYVEGMRGAGTLRAMIHYYRAALWYGWGMGSGGTEVVRVPTLVVWGERDPFLVRGLAEDLEQWVPGVRVMRLAGAGHWAHLEEADAVNEALLRFLEAPARGGQPRRQG